MASAIDAERITHKAFQRGMRGSIIRPSMLYSADSSQTQAILNGLKSGVPLLIGNGQNFWSFVHPYDVGTAIVRLLQVQPPCETYNLSDEDPVRKKDCLVWLAQETHSKPPKSIAPFLAKMGFGGDMVDLLTASRRISNAKAKRDLEWQPRFRSFREGFTSELTQSKA
jgi:nucleoside-diphosphate-sugar epimerase